MSMEVNSSFSSESIKRYKKVGEWFKPEFSPEFNAQNEVENTIWEMNNLKVLNQGRSSLFLATKAKELAEKRDSIFEQYPDIKTSMSKDEYENMENLINKKLPANNIKFDSEETNDKDKLFFSDISDTSFKFGN